MEFLETAGMLGAKVKIISRGHQYSGALGYLVEYEETRKAYAIRLYDGTLTWCNGGGLTLTL